MRKKIGIFLLSSMLIGLCGCNQQQGAETQAKESAAQTESQSKEAATESTQVSEAETKESEVKPEETEASEEVEKKSEDDDTVTLLHPIIKNYSYGYAQEGSYDTLRTQEWDEVFLKEDDAAYANINATLKTENDTLHTEYYNALTEDLESVAEWRIDMEDPYLYFYQEIEANIVRADSRVLSIQHDYDGYTGGIHGYFSESGRNFDTQTGKELVLKDLFKDLDQLQKILYEKLIEDYEGDLLVEALDEYLNDCIKDNLLNFVVGYDGVTFFFNPYDISYYAAGILTEKLTFQSYPELFVDYYTAVPDAYVIPGELYKKMELDVNNDKAVDEILMRTVENEYEGIEALEISVNDVTTSVELYAFSIDPYFVKTESGKVYIYLFCHAENDYVFLQVYDCAKQKVLTEWGENLHLSGSYMQLEDSNMSYGWLENKQVLSDPNHMEFSSRMHQLGTMSAYRTYHIGADGMPVADTDSFLISSETLIYTTLTAITMKEVDEQGKEIGSIVVPQGTECCYFRTDGETYADFVLGDGKIARVMVDSSEWPITIDGIDCMELFDGIIFAG